MVPFQPKKSAPKPHLSYAACLLSDYLFLVGTGVTANSLHPGIVDTSIWNTLIDTVPPLLARATQMAVRYALISPH